MASRVSPGFSVVDMISSFYAEKFSDLSHLLHNIIHLSYTDFLTHTTFFVISGHQKDSCLFLKVSLYCRKRAVFIWQNFSANAAKQ